jgi:Flp pilus assembly protein TadB
VIAGLVCGAGAGAGLWLAARGLAPPRPSLAASLAQLRHVPPRPVVVADDDGGWAGRLGAPLARALHQVGGQRLLWPSARRDLPVLGRPPERHLAEKTTLGLLGLLLPAAVTALLALGGVGLSPVLPVWGGLLLAAGGFVLPDLGAHADAQARRRDLRHALSAFLDLVTISLAGGGGVETALRDAAATGTGWAYQQLQAVVETARITGDSPSVVFGRLGDQLAVPELIELAASVQLAGTEGAKVRTSLTAKAASLRAHELADAESQAQAATERMSLPVVCLFAGFLLFISYPAITRVLTGL